MADFALGMGSNLGNRINNLVEGIRYLLSRSCMGRFRLSGVYETPPLEGVEGGDFLNCVFIGNFYGTDTLTFVNQILGIFIIGACLGKIGP